MLTLITFGINSFRTQQSYTKQLNLILRKKSRSRSQLLFKVLQLNTGTLYHRIVPQRYGNANQLLRYYQRPLTLKVIIHPPTTY